MLVTLLYALHTVNVGNDSGGIPQVTWRITEESPSQITY